MKQKNDNILIAGLYIVATPIGNLGDFSLRAIETLKSVDIIACEDTRTSKTLLNYYQISKKLISYHDHNATKVIPSIIDAIKSGKSIALISDAGSPLINDPGHKLVSECKEQDIYVTSIPGACAVITALQLSGLASDSFLFKGFLPVKSGEKQRLFEKIKNYDDTTVIFYETAPRILATLSLALEVFGDIRVCIARELTKKFEEVTTDSISNLIKHYTEKPAIKGEIVLLMEIIKQKQEVTPELITSELSKNLKNMDKKQAISHVAKLLDIKKKMVYDVALNLDE